MGCSYFFAYSWKLPFAVEPFLLTLDNFGFFYLQLEASLLTSLAFLLTVEASLLTSLAFYLQLELYSGKVRLIRAFRNW